MKITDVLSFINCCSCCFGLPPKDISINPDSANKEDVFKFVLNLDRKLDELTEENVQLKDALIKLQNANLSLDHQEQ